MKKIYLIIPVIFILILVLSLYFGIPKLLVKLDSINYVGFLSGNKPALILYSILGGIVVILSGFITWLVLIMKEEN